MTYKVQIDDRIRDATPEEAQQIEDAIARREADEAAAAAALEARKAPLRRLGLTEDEINTVLGL